MAFPGSGGSDVLEFHSTGLYLIQFLFTAYPADEPFSNIDIGTVSTLSGVTYVSGSELATYSVAYYFVSYDLFNVEDGGTITFPDMAALVTLYGANWTPTGMGCNNMSIIRLS